MLTKQQIEQCDDAQIETVNVPEWDGDVGIRVITGSQRQRFEQLCEAFGDASQNGDSPDLRTTLCAMAICDERGAAIFGEDDVAVLAKKNSVVLDRLFDLARKLNHLMPGSRDIEKKDSPAATETDSGTS
ncbi:MAG TPA: hypothetical protein ENI79_02315 [Rhodospirillales bacterium]|nr:hypothetical protein [Rhodospirillales bacterium]